MTESLKQPKTTRRSRRPRMSRAILSSEPPNFKPTTADWRRMEAAYTFKLGVDDRDEIVKLVTSYFYFAPFERSAPFVGDAEKWLAKVREAGECFLDVLLFDEKFETENERQAASEARLLIEERLKERDHEPVIGMDDVNEVMTVFLEAVGLARTGLGDINGRVEGKRWHGLIKSLRTWFKAKELPIGAPKDSDKSNKRHPFVAFVMELQRTFPKEYQRHMTSDAALAKAMGGAEKTPVRDLKSEKCGE